MSVEEKHLLSKQSELLDKPIDLGQNRFGVSLDLGGDFATLLEHPEAILPTLPEPERVKVIEEANALGNWFSSKTQNPLSPTWSTGEHRERATAAVVRQVLGQNPDVKILGADLRETPPGAIETDLRQKLGSQLGLPATQIKVSGIGDRLTGRGKSFLVVIRGQGEEETARAISKLRKDSSIRQVPILVSAGQEPPKKESPLKRLLRR